MRWFSLLFPPAMILVPTVTAFSIPARAGSAPATAGSHRVRSSRNLLVASTAVALGLWFAAWLALPPVWSSQTWALSFLVWAAAAPFMRTPLEGDAPVARSGADVREPESRAAPRVRAASLENRLRGNPVPARAWAPGWILFAAGATALLARLAWPMSGGAAWLRWSLAAGLFAFVMSGLLVGAPIAIRRSLLESEPRDPTGKPEIARAWERFRRGRTWGLYAGFMLMAILSTGVAVTLGWISGEPGVGARAGIVFGVAGSIVGLAGGVFGFRMGRERMRIERRVRELAGNGAS